MNEDVKVSTRFEWFDAAGNLLRTDEVEGDGRNFYLDTTNGIIQPLGIKMPDGSARVCARCVYLREAQ